MSKKQRRNEKIQRQKERNNFFKFVARCGERLTSTGEVFSNWDMVRKHESHCPRCTRVSIEGG